uniref:Uncharacterized protein n=1 Tax=Candidatus Kentrum sp. LPFa TaxID=2126335 RepID=A0A450WT72_9GAMM|nr:MAG: hypothetical protein BECKLPF1236A_GA0070988_102543 [Candidatus Kentron sp. LPFa]VFK34286.1 MAG: hypothetical protein BECKLPF1236C_GA0070990_102573 [Candidatus Kentron sp. LPFa]
MEIVGRQVWPTLAASIGIIFMLSWDEYIVAWFVSGFDKTYPVHIRNMLESTMSPEIHAAGILVALASGAILLLSARLLTLKTND